LGFAADVSFISGNLEVDEKQEKLDVNQESKKEILSSPFTNMGR
jgi:hypothetical protein